MAGIPTTGETTIVIQMPETAGGDLGAADSATPGPAAPQRENNTSGNPVTGDKNKQAKLATAIQVTKTLAVQAVNSAISTIGVSTGNYYQQRKAEKGMQAVSQIVGLAVSAANPVTFAVTVASMAMSAGAEYYQQKKEREIENYKAEQYAKRLGYTRDRK